MDNFESETKKPINFHLRIMKTLKSILTVFALAAVFSSASFAQETQDIAASAVVLADISLTFASDVSFGNIQDTGSPVLDPQGTNTADVGAGATFGSFSISANGSTQLLIDWDQTTVTLNDGGANNLDFTPDVSASNTATIGTSSDVTKNTANAATATSAGGALTVYVGGSLETSGGGAMSGEAAGTYTSANGSGDLTFTVNYQ
jgi:hypothetical protein